MIVFLLAIALSAVVVYYLLLRVRMCRGDPDDGKVRYPPISKVLEEPALVKYDLSDITAPPATGLFFKLLIHFVFSRLGQWTLLPYMKRGFKVSKIGEIYLPEKPTLYPTPYYPPPVLEDYLLLNQNVLLKLLNDADSLEEFHFPTVADYRRAYTSGRCTPTDMANAALNAIDLSNKLDPPLRAIIDTNHSVVLAMAEASTERWKTGKTLSLLDGIPISLKGMFRVEPYEFLAGCACPPEVAQGTLEAAITCKLKDAGAIIIGIANLQEFGTGTLGSNPNERHLTARNAYNTQYYCGGSSSGSGVSVSAGLCPISIGTDGGGSVRIPAAMCGVVGLKHTYGLVDMAGCVAVSHTVGVAGPLCSSVLDAAIAMDVISRETDGERVLMSLEDLDNKDLSDMKVGVYWDLFNHADQEIVDKCKAALNVMETFGVEIVDIVIPELDNCRLAHFVSIVAEMSQSLAVDTDSHFSDINLETLLVISGGLQLSANEYLNAQKQRTRAVAILEHIFKQVDVIVTPTTACIVPPITPDAVPLGEINATISGQLMRFAFLANLCGNPALTVPVGYVDSGLPIGVQLMGRCYEERVLLRLGLAMERSGQFPLKKPEIFYNLLEDHI